MSETTIQIQIGCSGHQLKQKYEYIEINFELHHQKLAKINENMSHILSKSAIPVVVIEYPQLNIQKYLPLKFNADQYQTGFAKSGNKLYQYVNPSKQKLKIYKTIEREFQKISNLNNFAHLKLGFYDPFRLIQHPLDIFDSLIIKGNLKTDQGLYALLLQIIRRISTEFINSPIMAFLQIFQLLTVKADLQPIKTWPEQTKSFIQNELKFGKWLDKQKLEDLKNVKGQIVFHFTLPKLMSLTIKGSYIALIRIMEIFE